MRGELRDSLEFLYADSEVKRRPCRSTCVDVARRSVASVHVLLNGLRLGATLRAAVRRDGRPVSGSRWYRLVDVPVEVNTGPVSFVEKEGELNPFVARRAPFRVYDVLAPMATGIRVPSATVALRLHLPVPANAPTGEREYNLEVRSGRDLLVFSLGVRVHRPVVPPAGRGSFPYTNWFSLDLMARRHGIVPWGEAHWRMIRRYADLMVHGRQNTFLLPLGDFFAVVRGMPVLDRVRLRRLVRTFTDAGMHHIEGGHVASRSGGEWDARTFDLNLVPVGATSADGDVALAEIARQLMEEIVRNGWRERWIQHATDEPTAANADDYRILVGMVHKYMPGIPVLDATMDPGLVGSVDIWCPQAQAYQRQRGQFEGRRATGDRIWFYTCCVPGGPWLNRLLDMELLRPALLGWAAARFNLDGFLHWGLNHYRPWQDPFDQSVVKHGKSSFLPPGDTHIVYPGADGPWSSLRLEAQREGFEDLELLRELRHIDGQTASRIVRRVVRGFDRYTRDVTSFRRARRALLEALS